MDEHVEGCMLCPRECGSDREKKAGFCGVSGKADSVRAAKAMLHFGEEPPISGTKGSGAIFFSGCNMRCVYCQNYMISSEAFGRDISLSRLSDIFLELQEQGAHNINLVTGTHYVPQIVRALEAVRGRLYIPVVFNCGGYEKTETIRMLDGLADIYLPDVKYFDDTYAVRYSGAKNYFEKALAAVREMVRQTGKYRIHNGIMSKGVIVRHMILPGCHKDSIRILEELEAFKDEVLISLMRQYYPCGRAESFSEINRRLTTFEYRKVLDKCEALGFNGFVQDKSAACGEMTPSFDLDGI